MTKCVHCGEDKEVIRVVQERGLGDIDTLHFCKDCYLEVFGRDVIYINRFEDKE